MVDVVVAIDGPSGAGKSSTARGVASRLGLRYLDTGAMYRAVTLWFLQHDVDANDSAAVAGRAASPRLDIGTDPASPTITLDGQDVAESIRSARVTAAVSAVAAVPAVRGRLVQMQREVIGRGGIVVEGRDIGTTVTPDAAVKIFLTASTESRAARRSSELDPQAAAEIGTVQDLTRRDHHDSTRVMSPLAQASDALVVDTTDLTLEQVIDLIVARVPATASS